MCYHLKLGDVDPTPINAKRPFSTMNLKPWLSRCRDSYKQVYKNGVNLFDYISPNCVIEKFLNKWFNEKARVCIPLKYALIARYNSKDHKSFENGQKILPENISDEKHNLIINLTDGCLHYIKSAIATTNESIQEENANLDREIKGFKELHRETFNFAHLPLQKIIILPNEANDTIKEMNRIDDLLLLTENELESPNFFHRLLNKMEENYYEKKDSDMYVDMLSRILGFLSVLFEDIPHIHDDSFTMIKKIPLTPTQRYVVDSNELRHVILEGSYGTGKTLVLQKKIFKLVTESTKAISIYIILGDSASMLYGETKNLLVNYREELNNDGKKVKIESCFETLYPNHNNDDGPYDVTLCLMTFKEYFCLKDLDPSNDVNQVLGGIVKAKENMHIFIDEFDAEKLTEDAAIQLGFLIEHDFKNFTVFIVPQPLQIHRSIDQTSTTNGYCFDETKTKMRVISLLKAIRNPECIHKLFKVAEEVIQEFKPEYKPKKFEAKSLKESDKTMREEYGKSIEHKEDIKENPIEDEKDIDGKTDIKGEEIGVEHTEKKDKPDYHEDDVQNDLPDESFFQKTFHNIDEVNTKRVVNSYQIKSTSECGHAFSGDIPTCYIPFKIDTDFVDEISNQPLCHLELALLDANAHKNGSVVICSTMYQSDLCFQALRNECEGKIKTYLPSLNLCKRSDAVESYQILEDVVTITDFAGVRGMELKNVIVVISTVDYYFVPFLLETFTRASGQLSIVLLNFGYENIKQSITIELVDRWYKEGLIKKVAYFCAQSNLSCDRREINYDIRECTKNFEDHDNKFLTKEKNIQKIDQADVWAHLNFQYRFLKR